MKKGMLTFCLCAVLVFASIGSLKSQSQLEWKGSREWKNGVEIIRNPKEPLYDEKVVTFAEDFRLETDSGMSHGIVGIDGIAVDESGNMFIVDRQANCVHVFDANGKPVKVIGRKGEGPGEFIEPNRLTLSPKGDLFVWSKNRISVFSPEGQYLRSYPSSILSELEECVIDKNNDIFGVRCMIVKKPYTREAVKCDSSFITIQQFESYELPSLKERIDPFTPLSMTIELVQEGLVVVASQDRYELRFYDSSGNLKKRIMKEYDKIPVTKKDIEQQLKGAPEEFVRRVKASDYFPPWRTLYCGHKGHVFVGTYEKSKEGDSIVYDIFDKDGRFIVKTPIAMGWIYCIKGDYIYMGEQDEEGYPILKRLRISWNN